MPQAGSPCRYMRLSTPGNYGNFLRETIMFREREIRLQGSRTYWKQGACFTEIFYNI
ncbi:predicted protein [Brucella pinnipedialis M163/99/10]|uniref:Uncharacterized protein n=2 Tax=Brucella pinnipedialis TaxID=120576 RepID=A0A0E1WWF1_9HYPH|nr:hypothetical protein BPI_II522 [Brucella pinnipedialis B2/94]EEY02089.1 predicted protein [Brucella pinnipedialis B2/94]EEY05916.1 predicted protein [Brucella pinnipedialis M163/99/10]EEZ29088.1 predicted protein [Brucella pinnipedialis M292/94/1]